MSEKLRLDLALVKLGLCTSRELAKARIMAGDVYVDGMKELKAGTSVLESANIELRGVAQKYVSRGGYKLEKAMENFDITLTDKVCMDIGASTGGFTDCMLQNGARLVYAIDVGYGQFAWKLRCDERVVCLEKTNIRYITEEQVKEKADFASVDVSFISLSKVIEPSLAVMSEEAQMVCLIKPQFEAGREKVGKKGVVKDLKVHEDVLLKIIDYVDSIGLNVRGLEFSPIKGPEGNIEYLIFLDRKNKGLTLEEAHDFAKKIATQSHELL